MKRRISFLLLLTVIVLTLPCGLIGNWPLSAAQSSTQATTTNAAPRVTIQVFMASINEEDAMAWALEWTFGRAGLGRLYFIEPTANEVPGTMAAILTTSQLRLTITAFEQRRSFRSFPGISVVSGRQGQIPLDDGQFIEVSPIVSADGFTVDINVSAALREFTADDNTAFRKTSLSATIRDHQAVMLGEAGSARVNAPVRRPVRVMILRAMITDSVGNPLHLWEERDTQPPTRFYWDAKPHARPAIPPQRPAVNR